MDKFEVALLEMIEAAKKDNDKKTYSYGFGQGFRVGLEDALAEYRKHKAEQDAPAFKVGDKLKARSEFTNEIVEGEVRRIKTEIVHNIVVRWKWSENSTLTHSYTPDELTSVIRALEPTEDEESEEAS